MYDYHKLPALETMTPYRSPLGGNQPTAVSVSMSGGSRNPVQVVPANNTTLPRSTSPGSLVEEEEVPVRTRPTAFGSPRHEEHLPLLSVDQFLGSQTQHRLSPTQTDDRTKGASDNIEGTSTSKSGLDDACNKTQHVASPAIGIDKWDTKDDLHIWQNMRAMLHQKNLVELISPQRPGPLGYLYRVFASVTNKQGNLTDAADFGYRIHFADLQRIHMQYLHSKLVDLAVSVHFNGDDWSPGGKAEEIGKVLKEYIQAVRDHEYMGKYARPSNNPFIATSQRLCDKKFLEAAMNKNGCKMPEDFLPPLPPSSQQKHEQQLPQYKTPTPLIEHLKKHSVPTGPWERDNTDKPARTLISTRTKAWKQAYWIRLRAALIGSAFLIAPMWIMPMLEVYEYTFLVSWGIATVCIVCFCVMVSSRLETVDGVFAATLAYAAVILVFVGSVTDNFK
ncbi:uncharacterized protein B0T23DRAFT_234044 [Neurospora hispaniola]|uniref:DUF6594 domain-containing protein n=1 Tax=Neurospora hispaniola TaxID=588809 RepID=A0AAJ0I172_9PEZI|nr:hypothetical protein B0T23DRAFT_234044 [Neurospora hispaniola]